MTSLWDESDKGGAGSLELNGMGKGMARIVKRSSDGDKSSIGYMVASADISAVRAGGRRFLAAIRLCLTGG